MWKKVLPNKCIPNRASSLDLTANGGDATERRAVGKARRDERRHQRATETPSPPRRRDFSSVGLRSAPLRSLNRVQQLWSSHSWISVTAIFCGVGWVESLGLFFGDRSAGSFSFVRDWDCIPLTMVLVGCLIWRRSSCPEFSSLFAWVCLIG